MKKSITVFGKPSLDTGRRNFLKMSGLGAMVAGLVLVGCNDDMEPMYTEAFDLGMGDVGVLNYAYALEQLEADFYTKVVNNFYTGASTAEKARNWGTQKEEEGY